MSVLNFWSHGVRGSILHMDTLEEKFYRGWRVNKYLYHGIPVPHIEEIHNVNDAYDFYELKNSTDSGIVDNHEVEVTTLKNKRPLSTTQSTLM